MDIEPAAELEALVAALRALPQITQRVFVLRKVYSLPGEQIASRVGLSEGAVVQHLVAAALACVRAQNEPLEYPTVATDKPRTRVRWSGWTARSGRESAPPNMNGRFAHRR